MFSFLKKEFEARKKHGFKVKWLEEGQVFKQCGFSSPGAILSDVAATADAYLLTHSLLQYNIAKGLIAYDRTPVVSIKHSRKQCSNKNTGKNLSSQQRNWYMQPAMKW
jgi:glycine/D-amino acid oxidase-like deaminating enzyme